MQREMALLTHESGIFTVTQIGSIQVLYTHQ